MRHGRLRSIGHNLADSFASGQAFTVGHHPVDVFAETTSSRGGTIQVDFLEGRVVRGDASEDLRSAVRGFAAVLPEFCRRNGALVSDFRELSVVFTASRPGVVVTLRVVDRTGRGSETDYAGSPLRRILVLDGLGRPRRTAWRSFRSPPPGQPSRHVG